MLLLLVVLVLVLVLVLLLFNLERQRRGAKGLKALGSFNTLALFWALAFVCQSSVTLQDTCSFLACLVFFNCNCNYHDQYCSDGRKRKYD